MEKKTRHSTRRRRVLGSETRHRLSEWSVQTVASSGSGGLLGLVGFRVGLDTPIDDKGIVYAFWLFFLFLRSSFHAFLVNPVHCSRDPQTSFFNKNFIKNGSHGTIQIIKNYFATVFSVFNKISSIQTHPKCILTKLDPRFILLKFIGLKWKGSESIMKMLTCLNVFRYWIRG